MNSKQKITVAVSTLLFASALLFAAALIFATCHRDHYEFHQALDGAVLWRCNKQSGMVEYCTFNGGWQTVMPQAASPPLLDDEAVGLPVSNTISADAFLDRTNDAADSFKSAKQAQ